MEDQVPLPVLRPYVRRYYVQNVISFFHLHVLSVGRDKELYSGVSLNYKVWFQEVAVTESEVSLPSQSNNRMNRISVEECVSQCHSVLAGRRSCDWYDQQGEPV